VWGGGVPLPTGGGVWGGGIAPPQNFILILHHEMAPLSGAFWVLYFTVQMPAVVYTHNPPIYRYVHLVPWFDADCESRRQSRMLERRYRRTGADADRLAWIKQLKTMYAVYEEKGHQHWRTKIADSRGNTKKLWHTMRGILGETKAADGMTVTVVQRTLPSSLQTKLTPSAHQPPAHHLKISTIQRATSSTSGSL